MENKYKPRTESKRQGKWKELYGCGVVDYLTRYQLNSGNYYAWKKEQKRKGISDEKLYPHHYVEYKKRETDSTRKLRLAEQKELLKSGTATLSELQEIVKYQNSIKRNLKKADRDRLYLKENGIYDEKAYDTYQEIKKRKKDESKGKVQYSIDDFIKDYYRELTRRMELKRKK